MFKLDKNGARDTARSFDNSKLAYKLRIATEDNSGTQYEIDWIAVLAEEVEKRLLAIPE